MTVPSVRLKSRKTVGCYFLDDDGYVWAAFRAVNHTVTCDWCGATITSGYWRGDKRLLAEQQVSVCATHVMRDDD